LACPAVPLAASPPTNTTRTGTFCSYYFYYYYYYYFYYYYYYYCTALHRFNGLFSRTTWVSQYQKGRPTHNPCSSGSVNTRSFVIVLLR